MSKQDFDNDMYESNLISLLDDEGNEYEFEIIEELDYQDRHYYALMPLFDMPDDEQEDSENVYMIFEDIMDENGEPQLAEIDDEELLDTLAGLFEEKFDLFMGEFDEDEEIGDEE